MKSLAAALAFTLAPAVAQAQVTQGDRDQLCYSYSSQTPASAYRLLKPEIQSYLGDLLMLPAQQRARATLCIQGVLQSLIPAVRAVCLAGEDPTALLETGLGDGVINCAMQSEHPPTQLFPGVEATSAPRRTPRGLLR